MTAQASRARGSSGGARRVAEQNDKGSAMNAAVVGPLTPAGVRARAGMQSAIRACPAPRHRCDRGEHQVCRAAGFGKKQAKAGKSGKTFLKEMSETSLGLGGRLVAELRADSKPCPCGSGQAYGECCQVYHNGKAAPTAEALMRARYTAYAKKLADYIVDTTHPDNPAYEGSKTPDGEHSSTLREDVIATSRIFDFEKLKVEEVREGKDEDEAYVGFTVWGRVTGQKGQRAKGSKTETIQELSRWMASLQRRFVREDGKWWYIDGDTDWVHHSYGDKKAA
ncbi:unnamed protein product [Pedinophyceae sp. YPF-701]|nr:unnamed protein product [Pedinophyceae sp. YPF-701]